MPKSAAKGPTKKPSPARGLVHVALLRGINVGGNRKVPMAELRQLAEALGWQQVASYIQSGNLVFVAAGKSSALEAALEQAIEPHFGFAVPVLVRTGAEWLRYAEGSAFAEAETARPNLLHLALAKRAPKADAAQALLPYCKHGERLTIRGEACWIDFADGVAKSKLSPAVLDRLVGSTVTARNWKTVQELAAMVRALQA